MAGAVVGIGVFFKARDPKALDAWYARVLGLKIEEWGGTRLAPAALAGVSGACQVWTPFVRDTNYFDPSTKEFMVNLVVDDLTGVLARAEREGVTPIWRDDADPNGRFAHLMDPEGTKIELWQPKAA
jgi:predicted enzyme related to lactoylglutathione lyase